MTSNPISIEDFDADKKFFESMPISKEEMAKRIDECFLDFSLCLPIYDEDTRRNIRMVMEIDTADLIPEWFHDLGLACKLYMRQFMPYLDYLEKAIPYIKGTSDVRPPIDVDESLRDDAIKRIQQQIKLHQIKADKKNRKERRVKCQSQ